MASGVNSNQQIDIEHVLCTRFLTSIGGKSSEHSGAFSLPSDTFPNMPQCDRCNILILIFTDIFVCV